LLRAPPAHALFIERFWLGVVFMIIASREQLT